MNRKENNRKMEITTKEDMYISPEVKITNILIEQSVLQSSSTGSGTTSDLKYDDGWW